MDFDFTDAIDQAVAESKLDINRQKIGQAATNQHEVVQRNGNGRVRKKKRLAGALDNWGHEYVQLNPDDYAKIENDTITPSQFYEKTIGRTSAHALMSAVLEDALEHIKQNSRQRNFRETRLFHEDMEWVMSDDANYIFDFIVICQHLNIDADSIRDSVKKRFPNFTPQ